MDRHAAFNRHIEFHENTSFDRYSLYLRPLDPLERTGIGIRNGIQVPGATESQDNWGGLHCTLCSFAPVAGRGCPMHHDPSDLRETLDDVFARASAVSRAAPRWQLACTEPLPVNGQMLMLYPTATDETKRTLEAIAEAVAEAGMLQPRPAADLHISIGGADAARVEAVRTALANALWEVRIAKCQAGQNQLRVTQLRESRQFGWGR